MTDDENMGDLIDGDGPVGEAVKRLDPTVEQHVGLRRTIESLQQLSAPSIQLLENTFKNIAAISRIAESQRATMARAIKPLIDAQLLWQKNFASINSDIFKTHDLVQSNLNLVAAQLMSNVDFGITESAVRTATKFAEQQASWLETFAPTITQARANFYPPNLRSIEDLKFREVEQVVMVDGIPLYGVPRTSIAEALIEADSASGRREIIGRRWNSISADCRMAADGYTSKTAGAPYRRFTLAALDALDAGHTEAAQTLAGSLVDAILSSYFGDDRRKYTPNRKGKRTKDAYDDFDARQFIAFAPIWQTYQQYFVYDGDKVPTTFSRHATAHTVHPRQFNRRNAVQGLMVVCSLLYRLEEDAQESV